VIVYRVTAAELVELLPSANAGIAMAQTIATASSAAMSFFIAFFMEKSSFLFSAPCRPLHFAQGVERGVVCVRTNA